LSVCLFMHHAMKMYPVHKYVMKTYDALDGGGEWSVACPSHFTP